MKLIKWILSHGVLIIIVVLVALGIYFRTELFPEYFAQHEPAPAREVAGKPEAAPAPPAEQPAAAPPAEEPPAAVAPPPAAAPPAETAAVLAPPPAAEPAVAQAPTVEPAPAAEMPSSVAETDQPSASEPPAAPTAVVADEQPPAEPISEPAAVAAVSPAPAVAEQPERAAAEPAVAQEPSPEREPQAEAQPAPAEATQLRSDARQAFWRGDYDQAVSHYESLAALKPQDPNPYGELGNVYFGQGKWSDASAAYLEAGKRLVALNRIGQAMHLQRLMVGLDAERAQELERVINEAVGTTEPAR